MTTKDGLRVLPALAMLLSVGITTESSAGTFSVSYLDGGTWNTVFAQGFSPSLEAVPSQSLAAGDLVELDSFSFFRSGFDDGSSDIRLAITDTLYPDLSSFSTSSPSLLGLSTNTIASTLPIALGETITFGFDGLAIPFGGDYGAIAVNVGSGGELTPVLVSALTADFVETSPGVFEPESNYGDNTQFQYTTSNFISGSFFSAFGDASDANFQAEFSVAVPEPVAVLMALPMFVAPLIRRR